MEFGKIFSGWQIFLLRHTGDFQKTGLVGTPCGELCMTRLRISAALTCCCWLPASWLSRRQRHAGLAGLPLPQVDLSRPPSNRGKIPVTAVRVPIKKRGPVNLPGRRTKMRRSAREIEEDGEAPHVGDPKPPRRTAHSTSALPGEKPVIKWEGMTIFSPGGPSK